MSNENICINCKRCINSDQYNCPWSEKGEEVPEWTAVKTKVYVKKYINGRVERWQGYHITECPMFIKDKEFMTYGDAARTIAAYYKVTEGAVYHSWEGYLRRYEKDSKQKLPRWIWLMHEDTKLTRGKKAKAEPQPEADDDDKHT